MSFSEPKPRFVSGPEGTMDSYTNLRQENVPANAYAKPYSYQQSQQFQQQIQSQPSPAASNQQSLQFGIILSQLLKQSSRDIRRNPRVGHKELDLYQLFIAVQRRGGYKRITQWKYLAQDLDLPTSVTNSGYILRTKYESFLLPYEQQLLQQFPVDQAVSPDQNGANYSFAGPATIQFNQQQQQFNNPINSFNAPAQQLRKRIDQPIERRLLLTGMPFTDELLRSQIKPSAAYEEIELSDLRGITQIIPANQFPKCLRVLKLHGVPNDLVPQMFLEYAQLSLVEMQIEAAGDGTCNTGIALNIDYANSSNMELNTGAHVQDLD